jgi:hypothetical protein
MMNDNNIDDEKYIQRMDNIAKLYPTQYASYSCDEEPEEIAFLGKCMIYSNKDDFFGNGKRYVSKLLINPTFGEIFKLSDDYIQITEDYHHCFFEGIQVNKEICKDIFEIDIFLGS